MRKLLPAFDKVAILGVGLLGGSIGLALRRAGYAGRIAGFGWRRKSLDAALDVGAVDSAHLDLAGALADADLVILATPIGLFPRLLAESGPLLRAGALVTDVGSTKGQAVRWAGKLLPRTVLFVGSHPIAGSDKRGVQFARADLFDGACCVLTPKPPRAGSRGAGGNSQPRYESAVRAIDRFWRALGMWTIRLSPALHDRYLAEVSHLPHAAAAGLVLLGSRQAQDLAGPGFLDSTRIAGGDPELWRDIFLTNAREVVRAIEALNSRLARLARLIDRGDGPGVVRFLADAQRRRNDLMARRLKRRRVEG